MGAKKFVHPAVSGAVLFVGLLSAVTFAGIYYLTSKAEVARDNILVKDYKKVTELYSGAIFLTNVGKVEISFLQENVPVTIRNFTRVADAGVFENTLLQADKINGVLKTGASTQQIDRSVLRSILGRGRKLKDKISLNELQKGMVAMRFNTDTTRPDLIFVLDDYGRLPPDFVVFGSVISGMDFLEDAYTREISNENENPPILIRGINLDDSF